MKVKVTSCKELDFFHEKFKKQEKEAGTNFNLLTKSRNMIRQLMKTYLHRPTKILQFLTPGRIQKFSITSKYFSFFENMLPASCVAHITRDFLTCYSCSYYSSMLYLFMYRFMNSFT